MGKYEKKSSSPKDLLALVSTHLRALKGKRNRQKRSRGEERGSGLDTLIRQVYDILIFKLV